MSDLTRKYYEIEVEQAKLQLRRAELSLEQYDNDVHSQKHFVGLGGGATLGAVGRAYSANQNGNFAGFGSGATIYETNQRPGVEDETN